MADAPALMASALMVSTATMIAAFGIAPATRFNRGLATKTPRTVASATMSTIIADAARAATPAPTSVFERMSVIGCRKTRASTLPTLT